MSGDIDFWTGRFTDFEQFKIDSHFINVGQVKIDLVYYYWLWAVHGYFTEFG